MKGSLIIVSFFIVGTFCGLYHLIPYEFTHSNLSYYALCGLMFCVGISIGNDPNTLKSFRSLNPRLLFLPVMTILGTLAGCAVASLFLPHRSATDCMAVGAGFGYYSLSSIFITEYKGAELGTIRQHRAVRCPLRFHHQLPPGGPVRPGCHPARELRSGDLQPLPERRPDRF